MFDMGSIPRGRMAIQLVVNHDAASADGSAL